MLEAGVEPATSGLPTFMVCQIANFWVYKLIVKITFVNQLFHDSIPPNGFGLIRS
jgi:hypothetical protein